MAGAKSLLKGTPPSKLSKRSTLGLRELMLVLLVLLMLRNGVAKGEGL